MPHIALLHLHVSSWGMALLLFVIAFIFVKANQQRGQKIVQMILRLFYLLVLFSGVYLLYLNQFQAKYIVKGLLAFWLIYTMEMILVRTSKNQLEGSKKILLWVQFILLVVVVLLLGYRVI